MNGKFKFAHCAALLPLLLLWCAAASAYPASGRAPAQAGLWMKFEGRFESSRAYDNPLYDVTKFAVQFKSPSGRVKKANGFWDGARIWKVRFSPDEQGVWTYTTECSDAANAGLHRVVGSFECVARGISLEIYRRGRLVRPKGSYHLTYSDGTPFFWLADTAWNGPLKSTDGEWKEYLDDRAGRGYNVIQFVATQWRGLAADRLGQVAFDGAARIRLNPEFFQRLDARVDQINERGMIAAPVLLWALPFARGKELSPGYYLPDAEAILLAKYVVARYGGNHAVWLLGGDGNFVDEYEQRWKKIGRGVFGEEHPGLVALHSMGRSWVGRQYAGEEWLDIIGYQSGHRPDEPVVSWINKGPVAREWDKVPARPLINMEPIYEHNRTRASAGEVRNATYWSLFSTPIAGVSYGAATIWPWLRTGEKALNHSRDDDPGSPISWREALEFPGGRQVGLLAKFMRQYEWWRLRPAPELLVSQPGDAAFDRFVSVVEADDHGLILAYVPAADVSVKLYNPAGGEYRAEWYDPRTGRYAQARLTNKDGVLEAAAPAGGDAVLILKRSVGGA